MDTNEIKAAYEKEKRGQHGTVTLNGHRLPVAVWHVLGTDTEFSRLHGDRSNNQFPLFNVSLSIRAQSIPDAAKDVLTHRVSYGRHPDGGTTKLPEIILTDAKLFGSAADAKPSISFDRLRVIEGPGIATGFLTVVCFNETAGVE